MRLAEFFPLCYFFAAPCAFIDGQFNVYIIVIDLFSVKDKMVILIPHFAAFSALAAVPVVLLVTGLPAFGTFTALPYVAVISPFSASVTPAAAFPLVP